ncbi:hypothetical protein SLNWT_0683 [Streptomyces albus]|uniref:Uncharacterized protein n=1 Tax=Streptomyces albus (strain ATCC 21838 / DSM 41398 / FERM P-419 / JCM 4703 / NBRC 107858) TaxID=1081613 RepID=A0A0B5EHZ9_STRA4|nr:hypothetical protein SLNWT_0683 [Streptomyces albus]AOU75371.1 hypothetical protein SLNHY_0680 [Streptomyces albus]
MLRAVPAGRRGPQSGRVPDGCPDTPPERGLLYGSRRIHLNVSRPRAI